MTPTPDTQSLKPNVAFWITLITGVIVRLVYINQPMRFDEAISFVRYASRPLSQSLTNYNNPNNHLLNTLLVRVSTQLTGSIDPWVIRLPAFIAGVLLIIAVYWTATRFFDERAALLAAALVAGYPQIIFYATNARGYSFVALSFIVLLGLAYDLRFQSNKKLWVVFIFVAVIGFYAVPSMIYPFAIVCIWLFLSIVLEQTGKKRRQLLLEGGLAVAAVGGLTWLLYAPVMRPGMREALSRSVSLDEFLPLASSWLDGTLILWRGGVPDGVFLLLVMAFVIGVWVEWQRRATFVPLWGMAITVTAGILLAQRPAAIGYHYYRLLFFLLPLCLVFVAAGIVYVITTVRALRGGMVVESPLQNQLFFAVLPVLIAIGGAVMVIENASVYNWKETGTFLEAEDVTYFLSDELQPGDAIICRGPCREILHYYFLRDGLDPTLIYADINRAERIFVVANDFEFMGQSLGISVDDDVFYQFDENKRRSIDGMTLLAELGTARVYRVLWGESF